MYYGSEENEKIVEALREPGVEYAFADYGKKFCILTPSGKLIVIATTETMTLKEFTQYMDHEDLYDLLDNYPLYIKRAKDT